MRRPRSRPVPAQAHPRQGACADFPPSRPSLSRAPGSLETRRCVPGACALGSGARASPPASVLAGGWWSRPVRTHGLRHSVGRAMPACQVRAGPQRRVRMKEGAGKARQSAGVDRASSAPRRPMSEAELLIAWAGGGSSNCQRGHRLRGSPGGLSFPPQK